MGVDPLEFRHADPVKFGELVAGLGPNYEKGCRPTIHKLVGSWSCSPDGPRQGETSQYEAICVACQAGSQFSGYMRSPHGPRRCVNE